MITCTMHNIEEHQCMSTLLILSINQHAIKKKNLLDKHFQWILYNSRIQNKFITQIETCTVVLSSSCISHFSMLPPYDAHSFTIYTLRRTASCQQSLKYIFLFFFFFFYFSLVFHANHLSIYILVYIINHNACIDICKYMQQENDMY